MFNAESQLLFLLLIASLVGMGARRLKLPYTVALVVAGIALGWMHLDELKGLHLTPDILMLGLLPALLFEAAYHIDFGKLRRDLPVVIFLAIFGVLGATAITGFGVYYLFQAMGVEGFSLGHALLFGSMIAATDPISVLALFKTLGVTKRLYLMVEGESLLNDGVAVVLFLIIAAVLGISTGHGHAPHLEGMGEIINYGLRTFVVMGVGGVLIGGCVGAVASLLVKQIDDKLIETALTVVVAYGSFLMAEHFHTSGVLSTVTAGVVLGTFGKKFGMQVRTRVAVEDFWEFMAFFSNTFVFLLVGLELDMPQLMATMGLIVTAWAVVLLARAAMVYLSLPVGRLLGVATVPKAWAHIMVWGGLRGSLSMVLIIGLPQDFVARELLLNLIFGVVSISLLFQAMTVKPLLARLGLSSNRGERLAYEEARARVIMKHAALDFVKGRGVHMDEGIRATLIAEYTTSLENAESAVKEAAGDHLDEEQLDEERLHLIHIEEEALKHAQHEGIVSSTPARTIMEELAEQRESIGDHGVGDDA
ncbi:MAG: sodium:proton antiporter [Planctomycetes bacterium]|nr:sodium:proton antiporter [Planctomycetota bacterium]